MSGSIVLIPGIMGSSLQSQGPSPFDIWTADIYSNYTTLLQNPAILNYNKTQPAIPVEIIRTFSTPPLNLLSYRVYGRTINFLQNYCMQKSLACINFPYDWRQSLSDVAQRLENELINKNTPFTFIAHSMGGLVIRVALTDGRVRLKDVERIIQIGTPLSGSAQAFRAVYQNLGLPFLSFLKNWLRYPKGDTAVKVLRDTMKTFESIYELFPPKHLEFLDSGIGGWISPLGDKDPVLLAEHKNRARIVHDKIKRSIDILASSNVPIVTIRSNGLATDTKYKTFVNRTEEIYEFLDPIPYENTGGDLRVTCESSTYNGQDAARDIRTVTAVEHAKMCNHRNVVDILRVILP